LLARRGEIERSYSNVSPYRITNILPLVASLIAGLPSSSPIAWEPSGTPTRSAY